MTRKSWLVILMMITSVLSVAQPLGAAETKRVVVAELDGDEDGKARRAVLEGLLGHPEIRVVSLAYASKLVSGAVDDRAGARSLGEKLGVAAVVEGELKKSGSGWAAKIRLRATTDGEVSEAHQFRSDAPDGLAKKLAASLWNQLGPGLVDAKSPRKGGSRLAVLELSGPKADVVRGWVQKAANRKKGVKIIPESELGAAAVGKDAKPTDLAAAAAALDASAFLRGEVTIKGKTASVELELLNGADGESLSLVTLKGGGLAGLKRSIDRQLVKKLEGPLSRAKPAEPPEETLPQEPTSEETGEGDASEGEEEEADTGPTAGAADRPSPLEVGGGLRAASRNFRYTDDFFDRLRAYKLGLAPSGFLWLRWFPLAHFQGGPMANVGLTGGYEQGFALESESATGEKFDTTSREWFAGLRGRIPFDRHELGVQATYGNHSFLVDDDPVFPLVPDVKYRYIRLGVDGRVRVSRVVIGAHIGYRVVSDAGDVQADRWFPQASVGGVDAGLQAGYEVVDNLDLVAGFDFRRYFYSMNSEPGDANVAGGALDEYIAGWVGFAYRLPGGS